MPSSLCLSVFPCKQDFPSLLQDYHCATVGTSVQCFYKILDLYSVSLHLCFFSVFVFFINCLRQWACVRTMYNLKGVIEAK